MRHILIVDDDIDLLFMLKKLLLTEGYTVTAVDDGHDIPSIMALIPPDLVVLDINLGEYDGREICLHMKESAIWCKVPVILYSGEPELIEATADYRADAFIEKPFTKQLFLNKITELLQAA